MKHSLTARTATWLLAAGILLAFQTAAFSQIGDFKSELKPNTTYTSVQKQIIEGTNGGTEMDKLESSQAFKIVTGAARGGTFPVTLTVYPLSRGDNPPMSDPTSIIEFEATTAGQLQNFKQVSGEGAVAPHVAPVIAGQFLESILLNTRYKLERTIKRTYKITSSDVKGTTANVKFTWDEISPSGKEEPNLVTKRTGKGTFDTKSLMYTSSETVKTSDISVPDDAFGAGKQVRMKTIVRYTTRISSK